MARPYRDGTGYCNLTAPENTRVHSDARNVFWCDGRLSVTELLERRARDSMRISDEALHEGEEYGQTR